MQLDARSGVVLPAVRRRARCSGGRRSVKHACAGGPAVRRGQHRRVRRLPDPGHSGRGIRRPDTHRRPAVLRRHVRHRAAALPARARPLLPSPHLLPRALSSVASATEPTPVPGDVSPQAASGGSSVGAALPSARPPSSFSSRWHSAHRSRGRSGCGRGRAARGGLHHSAAPEIEGRSRAQHGLPGVANPAAHASPHAGHLARTRGQRSLLARFAGNAAAERVSEHAAADPSAHGWYLCEAHGLLSTFHPRRAATTSGTFAARCARSTVLGLRSSVTPRAVHAVAGRRGRHPARGLGAGHLRGWRALL
jgi:hypothetical protein